MTHIKPVIEKNIPRPRRGGRKLGPSLIPWAEMEYGDSVWIGGTKAQMKNHIQTARNHAALQNIRLRLYMAPERFNHDEGYRIWRLEPRDQGD